MYFYLQNKVIMKKIVQILNVLLEYYFCLLYLLHIPGMEKGDGFSITHYLKEPEHLAYLSGNSCNSVFFFKKEKEIIR